MLYDNKAAAQLEQAYATTDMIVQREELRRSLRASAGESILDLGSGPGFLACELAQEVGATGRIVGVDISSDMNSIASKRIAAAGLGDRIEILEGDATALAFADATFDAAVSMQVIEYLAEPDAALHQLFRVLRPGGRLVIIDTDWDSLVWAATDRRRAARIAAAWNEHLPDPYLPRSLAPRLRAAGFELGDIRIVPILNTAYDATSFSYNIAPLIAHSCPVAEASQKTRQPNGSPTSQNCSTKDGTSLASIDTSSPRRVPQGGGPRSADWSLTIRLPRLSERTVA